jgi:hypothetical protein
MVNEDRVEKCFPLFLPRRYSLCLESRMPLRVVRKCMPTDRFTCSKFYLSTPWYSKYF